MRVFTIAVLAVSLLLPCRKAIASGADPGDPAPEINFREFVGAAADGRAKSLSELRGRVVVLEFWAPWCGSCVGAFPKMNELAGELKDDPIVFVAITDSERAAIERLLVKRPLAWWIVRDADSSVFSQYGVSVLPTCVVIDPAGRIAGICKPDDLTAAGLRALAAGQPVDLPQRQILRANLDWEREVFGDENGALGRVVLQRSGASGARYRFPPNSGHLCADGVSPGVLIALAYGAELHEVDAQWPGYSTGRLRASVVAPDGSDETVRRLLREVLRSAFSFEAEWVERNEMVPVLTLASEGVRGSFRPSAAGVSGGTLRNGEIDVARVDIKSITKNIGVFGFGGQVVDETCLSGRYDIRLVWTPGDRDSLVEALKGCGILVEDQSRPVKKLVVRTR